MNQLLKQKIIQNLKYGYLTSPEFDIHDDQNNKGSQNNAQLVLINKALNNKDKDAKDRYKFEENMAREEKNKTQRQKKTKTEQTDEDHNKKQQHSDIQIIRNYKDMKKKKTIKDFFKHYSLRFNQLVQLLRQREELRNTTSIKRIQTRNQNETVITIGMVKSKRKTKNGHILLQIEDQTGQINVLVNKNKNTKEEGKEKSLYEEALEICNDEVIGVLGNKGENSIIFASDLVWPDVPLGKEIKKSPEEEYTIFIGDTHFGSKHFLKREFNLFLNWINGKIGNTTQRETASKIKYLFIVGDLVEGVGIYPSQEEDLEVNDIYQQYKIFSSFLKKIPENIRIIICPGNHDPVRIHEPQPPIYEEYTKEIRELSNVFFVSSPSLVKIGIKDNFKGLDVLLYHGYSFPFYADTVETIRQQGGLERVDLILKYLMKRRHLAPEHGSTQFVPDYEGDPLIIKDIPDLVVTGHIHRSSATTYRNITLLNCSCWIGQTEYQEKRGIKPQPAKAAVLNMKTREIKMLSFAK